MSTIKLVNQNWHQLAKYGEHVMNCPYCRPIEGEYCEVANELSAALYGDRRQHEVVVRQSKVPEIAYRPRRRCRGEFIL